MLTGDISELTAIASAMKSGKEVAILYGNHRHFDFLIESYSNPGTWLTVQVKTARVRKGKLMVDTRRSKGVTNVPRERKYADGDFDFLAAVDGATVYVIPFRQIFGKTCINLKEEWRFQWP